MAMQLRLCVLRSLVLLPMPVFADSGVRHCAYRRVCGFLKPKRS